MMIHGIAHTAYKVRDMEASLRFYLNGLGMQHAFSLANKENRPWIEYLCVAPGQFIELFYPEGKAVEEDTRYMHLCLQIDDLPAYVAQLRERGIEVSEPTRGSDHNLQAWVHDPDGNAIELMQIDSSSPQAKW